MVSNNKILQGWTRQSISSKISEATCRAVLLPPVTVGASWNCCRLVYIEMVRVSFLFLSAFHSIVHLQAHNTVASTRSLYGVLGQSRSYLRLWDESVHSGALWVIQLQNHLRLASLPLRRGRIFNDNGCIVGRWGLFKCVIKTTVLCIIECTL